ncbi:MAG TPA: hypothetical protein VJK71_06385 [Gemmatimonadales bacterium]|nr:hypothetical protein [Gemmatimonadales bacterium]
MKPPLVFALLTLAPSPLVAQDPAQRALDLERRGDPAGAAALWRSVLAERPTDLSALVGLERVLAPLGRLPEMTDAVRTASARDPSAGVLGIAIRVWTAARQPDSARAIVLRWATAEPASELPYQEWGLAAYGMRDFPTARAAYLLGRERLGRSGALAAELGQLGLLSGDYASAAREWTRAMADNAGSRPAAIGLLSQTPAASRGTLLAELAKGGPLGERLAAGLEVRWGEPLAAVRRLEGTPDALADLLSDLGRAPPQPETALARARVLELLASGAPLPDRARLRFDAAQAYAEAGDQTSTRRILALLARDSTSGSFPTLAAASAMLGVLVEEGGLEEADRRYRALLPQLAQEDRERLALRLAQGWLRQGRLGRADTLLAADSSVEALAVRGKIALYRGDLAAARALLREAGPFTGDRASATHRIGVLGLLQVVDPDSLPALGGALFALERRDSAAAARELERVALSLPPDRGGAELLLLAGQVQQGLGRTADAERLYRAAIAQGVPAGSAAAEFALADLLLKSGKKEPAIAALEHLLLTWPTSAVVPQARRLLDVARGAVPSS